MNDATSSSPRYDATSPAPAPAPAFTVDVSAQKRLTSANAEAKRRVEIATRRDFAAQLQKEVEVQVASAEKRVADVAKEERTADEARWRTREAEWQAARKKLEAERDRLKRELAASERREAARAEEAVKLSETANDEHVKLQEVHAKALEESAAKNDELRRENKRLVTQQTLLEEEVQRAEHMTRLNVIEQEETKNAMFSAVRELVPLRREVVEQRQQLVEVGRATAELQHAKEEDQASFLIAKKATARIIKNKHLKALDKVVVQHKQELQQVEEKRQADVERISNTVGNELEAAETQYKERMVQMQEEEVRKLALQDCTQPITLLTPHPLLSHSHSLSLLHTQVVRRKEAQETLKRQLETEAVARVQHVETEYERTLEVERKAAAAKLVQTATRMNKDYRLSTEQQLQEQERSTAERLKEYAEDARQALDVQTQKAGRLETELEDGKQELIFMNAGLEGLSDLIAEMLHERSMGWEATEKQLVGMGEERDEWRKRADRLATELAAAKSAHTREVGSLRKLHKVEMAVLRKECVHGDGLTAEGWAKNRRINDLSDELRALRLAHQSLMMDARQVCVAASSQ